MSGRDRLIVIEVPVRIEEDNARIELLGKKHGFDKCFVSQ